MFIRKYISAPLRLILLSAVMAMTACVELTQDQDGACGYLTISGVDVDVTVESLVPTKSLALPDIDEPSSIIYKVTDKNGKTYQSDESSWTSPLVLPVGDYILEAWSGENTFGAPYFYGKTTGSLGVETKTASVTLYVANALVAVTLDVELNGHFNNPSITLTSGSTSHSAVIGTYCFVPSKADLSISVSGTNSAGKSATFTHTLAAPAPAIAYEVNIKKSSSWPTITWKSGQDLNDGSFEGGLYFEPVQTSNTSIAPVYQIKGDSYSDWTDVAVTDVQGYKYISGLANGTSYSLRARVGDIVSDELTFSPVSFQSCFSVGSVTAAHNNAGDANVELSSTTMTANDMKVNLPAIIAGMNPNATVTATGSFSSSNNKATGTFSNVTLSATAKSAFFTNASDWPYLPQGSYSATVSATCTLNGSEYTATLTATPIVPAPVFAVASGAHTSYSLYTAGKVSEANGCEASTIYKLQLVTPKIASNLLSKSNYNKSQSVTLDDKTTTEDSATGQSWGSHTVVASYTFDDEEYSHSNTVHITGLPYTLNTTQNADSWTEEGYVNWNTDGGVRLGNNQWGGEAYIEKSFSLPGKVNVKISFNGTVCGTGSYIKVENTFGLYVSETEKYSKTANGNTTVSFSESVTTVMESSKPKIKCNSSYNLEKANVVIKSLVIKYN